MGSFLFWFFVVSMSPLVYIIVKTLLKDLLADLAIVPDIYYPNSNSSSKIKVTAASKKIEEKVKTTYYNTWNKREVPPRPVFFCKLGEDEHTTVGNYEEKYLDSSSLYYWHEKCKKDNIPTNSVTKSTYLGEKPPLSEQKCEKTVDFDKK